MSTPDYKKQIENVLSQLKAEGHDRATIEDRLGYANNAIDQSLARGGSKKLLSAILLYRDAVLKNSIESVVRETLPVYGADIVIPAALFQLWSNTMQSHADLNVSHRNITEANLNYSRMLSSGGAGLTSSSGQLQERETRKDIVDAGLSDKKLVQKAKSAKRN